MCPRGAGVSWCLFFWRLSDEIIMSNLLPHSGGRVRVLWRQDVVPSNLGNSKFSNENIKDRAHCSLCRHLK